MNLGKPIPVEDLEFIHTRVDVERLRSMRGCITGATGWFGNWICSALDYMGCKYIKLDTRDLHTFDCDYCIHLAHGEVKGLINMLKPLDVKHVLFISSGAVYDRELSEYGYTKLEHENLFLASGLPVNIARCFTFTGLGVCQKALAIGEFINRAKFGEPIEVYNQGRTVRTYMYMAEIVAWLLNILLSPKGNIVDVGGKEPVCIFDLAHKISDNVVMMDAPYYFKEARPIYIPNLKPANELGLMVEIGLDEAIQRTLKTELQ